MANTTKITIKDILTVVKANAGTMEYTGTDVTVEDVIAYVDKQFASMEKKAESAKKRRAEKAAEADELTEKVFALVTEELQTADDITAALGDEEISRNKVIARLTKLEKAGRIAKEQVKVEDSKSKRMAYKLA